MKHKHLKNWLQKQCEIEDNKGFYGLCTQLDANPKFFCNMCRYASISRTDWP